MKKTISLIIVFTFANYASLFAQVAAGSAPTSTDAAKPPAQVEKSTSPTPNTSSNIAQGSAAALSTNTTRITSRQNWIFAGSALAIVAIGVVIVALNMGENSPTAH